MARVSRSVLVVMPDDVERRRVVEVVEASGHDAKQADDALEAVSFQGSFDLVVLSIEGLGDGDLRVFEFLRDRTPHIRVLLLVPPGRRMDALRFMEPAAGDPRPRADAMLALPFFETELRTLVVSLLRLEAADELTGFANRPAFEIAVLRQIAAAERRGESLAFGLLDIDDFGKLNKMIGYLAANQVLQEFADILRSEFRDNDILGRWGGEEFTVLAPASGSLEDVEKLFERVKDHVAEHTFETDRGPARITVSGGVARFPDDVPPPLRPRKGHYLTAEQRAEVGVRLFQMDNERLVMAKSLPGKNTIVYEGP